jgi:hypothetical protein
MCMLADRLITRPMEPPTRFFLDDGRGGSPSRCSTSRASPPRDVFLISAAALEALHARWRHGGLRATS